MNQHVRRGIERIFPASPEVSIPLFTVMQTGMAGVLLIDLRFRSTLVLASAIVMAVWVEPIPSQILMMLVAAAWSDRSAISYLRVWRQR